MSRTVVLALLFSGCGGIAEEADFADSLARAACSKMERCALGQFESTYSGREDCVREMAETFEDQGRLLDDADCEYQPQEASRCVRRVSGFSCEEWVEQEMLEACDLVYLCEEDTVALPTSLPVEVN